MKEQKMLKKVSFTKPVDKTPFDLNIRLLKLFGFWPVGPEESGRLYTASYYICRAWWASGLLFYPWLLYSVCVTREEKMDLKSISGDIFSFMTHSSAMIKAGIVFFRFKDIKAVIEASANMLKNRTCDDANEQEITARYQRQSYRFTRILMAAMMIGCVGYVLRPLVDSFFNKNSDHKRHLPVDGWNLVDVQLTPHYEISYSIEVFLCFGNTAFNGLIDSLCVAILINTISHFKILQYNLTNMKKIAAEKLRSGRRWMKRSVVIIAVSRRVGKNAERMDDVGEFGGNGVEERREVEELDVEMMRVLVRCVNLHRDLFSLIGEFQSVFGSMLLMYAYLASITYCVVAIQVEQATHVNLIIFWMYMMLTGLVMFYVPSWCATKLYSESENVCEAVYCSDWYDSSDRLKKLLVTVMAQTQRTLHLTTLGFMPPSLELLIEILRAAYSFYTVLKQIKLNK